MEYQHVYLKWNIHHIFFLALTLFLVHLKQMEYFPVFPWLLKDLQLSKLICNIWRKYDMQDNFS